MDFKFKFRTDTATLAIFDPQRLEHRINDTPDWWCDYFANLSEVQSGSIALTSLGIDGIFTCRVTTGDLSVDERDYAAELIADLGVEIVSDKLFFGPGECLPGGDQRFADSSLQRGLIVELAVGRYRVDIYAINWHDSPRWWSEDNRVPDGAPADYVVVLHPRTELMKPPEEEPSFAGYYDKFLFESSTRQIGPVPGMSLITKVRKSQNGLSLKTCGPGHYQATLVDFSPVQWKDVIRMRVINVDHSSREMTCEFVEKVSE